MVKCTLTILWNFVAYSCGFISSKNTYFFQLPRKEELKTVLDKVKDFFGDAKESFGKLTSLNAATESLEEDSKEQANKKST